MTAKYEPEFHFQIRGDREGIVVSANLPAGLQDMTLDTANDLERRLREAIPFTFEVNRSPAVMFPRAGRGTEMMSVEMSIRVPDLEAAAAQLERHGFGGGLLTPLVLT